MKIIDCSPQTSEKNGINEFARRAQGLLPMSLSRDNEKIAQELVIQHLKINTDSKYLLLRNIVVEPLNEPIPLLLIGPTGITILMSTGVKGIYKAKEDNWYELKGKDRQYQPSRPNLVFTTYQMARTISRKIQEAGLIGSDVQGVLIFTSPATHVEAIRPSVRIVLADGLKRFTAQIMQNPLQMTNQEVEKVKSLFCPREQTQGNGPEFELRDQFDFIEDAPPSKPIRVQTAPSTPPLTKLTPRLQLSNGQWIFLGILVVFQILMLVGIIYLFLM